MTAKIIDGRKIAEKIRNSVADDVKNLKSKYKTVPTIATIKIGGDPESDLYLRLRDNACEKVGIISKHLEFPADISEKKVIDSINELNKDSKVHGILIQFPIPSHLSSENLINALNPRKDVEGFTPFNMGRTLIGDEHIVPCTPLAVLKILEEENVDLKGKNVVIVNHSNIVGKPLAALFLNRNATVAVTHVFTKNLKEYTLKADILVTATGVQGLIKKEFVKPGAFVIDVGIIKTKTGVTGDVGASVHEVADIITPVPGGVGPVTVACSLVNMVKTFKNCIE